MHSGRHFLTSLLTSWTLALSMLFPVATSAAGLCDGIFTDHSALRPQEMNYKILGDLGSKKLPVVLIHGVGASLETFSEVGAGLSKGRPVVIYDLRGHGRSKDPGEGFQIETQARDLEALLKHLQISRFHLLGHSAGAKIAMEVAARNPKAVASIILEDSGPLAMSNSSRAEWMDTAKTADFLRSLAKPYKSIGDLELDLNPLYAKDPAQVKELAAKVFPTGPLASAVTKQFWIEFKTASSANFLARYQGPTLFLRAFPSTRYLTDRDVQQIHLQMPQAQIVDIKDGTHSIHRKQPQAWLENVTKFLGDSHE